MNIRLRRATPNEAEALTHLAMLSKQSWGYDAAFMHRVAGDMLVTEHEIATSHCIVAEVDGTLAAYVLVRMDGKEAFLRDLFVHPGLFRRGLGRTLFEEALRYARANNARRLKLDSDPNAEAFYERLGMVRTGTVVSIAGNGRTLPVMALDIPPS